MNEENQNSPVIAGGPMAPDQNTPVDVVDVQFRSGSKIYYFDPAEFDVPTGAHVIIETARGPEYGICTAGNHQVPFRDIVPPLRKVMRLATESDERTLAANRAKEKRAYEICQQKIQEHKLEMQLVSAEYAFDGSKILFFFTADDRVDFRELVKNLAGIFRTRIELRQIGVRDKAKMIGGLGICGRPFCCSQFLEDFQPVSIKMAKTQNLSLNPTKISGTCGRLMCCLKYEQEAYEDLLKTSPKAESFVDTPDGRGTVVEVNLLRQSVKVRMEEEPENINVYPNAEICVLRNGKAKKNDPPIPADLAPISGNGKRPRPVVTEQEPSMQLDPIRFRYRPDDIVEEEQQEEVQEAPKETPREAPRVEEQRRRKKPAERKPEEQKSREETPRQAEAGQESNAPQGKPEQTRRRNRPKPQKPQQTQEEKTAGTEEQPKQQNRPGKPRGNRGPRPRPEAGEGKPEAGKQNPPRQPRPERQKQENPAKQPRNEGKKQETAPKQPKAEGEQNNRRPRNNYRRRPNNRPKKPQDGANAGGKQGE